MWDCTDVKNPRLVKTFWTRRYLLFGGRITLIRSYLAIVLLYIMSGSGEEVGKVTLCFRMEVMDNLKSIWFNLEEISKPKQRGLGIGIKRKKLDIG